MDVFAKALDLGITVECHKREDGGVDGLIGYRTGYLVESRGETLFRVVPFHCPKRTVGVFKFGDPQYISPEATLALVQEMRG